MTQSNVNINFHPSKGTLLVGNGTTVVSELAAGTDDQVFTADSAQTEGNKWATPAGGGVWNFISSATASASSEIVFTSGIDSTYNQYAFTFTDIISGTDNVDLIARTSSDGGASYDSGASDYTGGSFLPMNGSNMGNAAGELLNAFYFLSDPSNSSLWTVGFSNYGLAGTTGQLFHAFLPGARESTAAVDAIQFLMSSGNISSGSFSLYGISNS